MLSTLKLKRADPLDQFIHDQEAVAISPAAEESSPAPDAQTPATEAPRPAPGASVPLRTAPTFTASDFKTSDFSAERLVPRNDSTFRAAAVDTIDVERQPSIQLQDNSPLGRSMKRAVTGLAIMLTGAVVTVGWQAYGDDAKLLMERWTHQVPLVSWLHLNHRGGTGSSGQPPVQAVDAASESPQSEATQPEAPQAASEQPAAPQQPAPPQQAASQQPAASAEATPPAVAPVAAAPSPESQSLQAKSLEAMTRDLATLQKGMEQLKVDQEQMRREIAKLAEQNVRRRTPTSASAASPAPGSVTRPVVTAPRRPVPPPLQATAQPRPVPPPIISPPPAAAPPVQLQQPPIQSEGSYVPRPPASVP